MAAEFNALVAGDANAFEQLCAVLMSSQNEQRSQVRGSSALPDRGGMHASQMWQGGQAAGGRGQACFAAVSGCWGW